MTVKFLEVQTTAGLLRYADVELTITVGVLPGTPPPIDVLVIQDSQLRVVGKIPLVALVGFALREAEIVDVPPGAFVRPQ